MANKRMLNQNHAHARAHKLAHREGQQQERGDEDNAAEKGEGQAQRKRMGRSSVQQQLSEDEPSAVSNGSEREGPSPSDLGRDGWAASG